PRSAASIEQDLYLLWPDEVDALRVEGKPDPVLARYVEERGYSVTGEGRLPLYAQSLYRTGGTATPQPIAGGAPFVSFVRLGGPLGLTAPVTYVRIPWTPLLANRTWLLSLRMALPRLVRPQPATWVENVFWGHRHTISLTFNDVRGRALFPLYAEHRDRPGRRADGAADRHGAVARDAGPHRAGLHDIRGSAPPLRRRPRRARGAARARPSGPGLPRAQGRAPTTAPAGLARHREPVGRRAFRGRGHP